jgi:hypothetical protein
MAYLEQLRFCAADQSWAWNSSLSGEPTGNQSFSWVSWVTGTCHGHTRLTGQDPVLEISGYNLMYPARAESQFVHI